jgi:hypothetical protein
LIHFFKFKAVNQNTGISKSLLLTNNKTIPKEGFTSLETDASSLPECTNHNIQVADQLELLAETSGILPLTLTG